MYRLKITIEKWDDKKEEFVYDDHFIQLEHSLVSVSKWESKWKKPFLSRKELTVEESIDYIKCMTLTQNVNPDLYRYLTDENILQVKSYIDDSMTATWFKEEKPGKPNREQITSELVYYWMVAYNIPFECQKWHLNRLLTLIRICNVKNKPPKKMSKSDLLRHQAAVNKANRQRFNSKG